MRVFSIRPRLILSALVLWLAALPSHADQHSVLVLVSERSAPTLVAGAHQLTTGASIQIRTVEQLAALTQAQLQSLILNHQSLALVAVFGDQVERLLALSYPREQFRLVIHSDRRLLPLHRDRQGSPFTAQSLDVRVGERDDFSNHQRLKALQQANPLFRDWLQARAYWVNRSVSNARHLLHFLASAGEQSPRFEPVALVRFALHTQSEPQWLRAADLAGTLDEQQPLIWVLDHDTGELAGEWELHKQFCSAVNAQCVSVLAAWGEPSVDAVRLLAALNMRHSRQLIVSLQDFVIGGGEGRARVDSLLAGLNVPILKGIRVAEATAQEYWVSSQGIPAQSVHYRVAMPELQGVSQPQVVALASPSQLDERTGARVSRSKVITSSVERLARRAEGWLNLQSRDNNDKRVAIVYYNHPPGRHNIGADNLNVPESLLEILRSLKAAGYDTGELPANENALLDVLQARGVNLPEDRAALSAMSQQVATLSADSYQQWFAQLPSTLQAEMRDGPLAYLDVRLRSGLQQAMTLPAGNQRQRYLQALQITLHNATTDIHHALDGLRHPGRERALRLLEQLTAGYDHLLQSALSGERLTTDDWRESDSLLQALVAMGIEGIRGWGAVPGKVMVWDDKLLVPGVQFGKVFVGPQPPRGWEINEELLHANLSFPPPHQYLGFYHYLHHHFKADALIHLGRHSTYEFLPRRSMGLGEDDYPTLIAGDVPGIYPYIVDGVGEGIQAKRRGLAVMVDHLTPPLAATELYDELLELRQLIESAEAATDASTRSRAVATLRQRIDELGLRDELIASMDEELTVRGVGFDDIDEEFLLHEVGHYLTNIQEDFMPLGLHVFGRAWSESALDTMLTSMVGEQVLDQKTRQQWRIDLARSPAAEMQALLNALNGRYVLPGKGNDPIRTPEALPTGRNFYALDGSLLPTRVGYAVGSELAVQALGDHQQQLDQSATGGRNKQGVILWASDTVRDEGAMIAFGLRLLGVKPVWNSRGILKSLERIPLGEYQPRRLDVVFNTSGLFRDLYGEHLVLLDKATLMALDASADLIVDRYPLLSPLLEAALAPLDSERRGGRDDLALNQVAANWVEEARQLLRNTPDGDPNALGRQASLRVFGIAPGAYGAGINRLAERSSAWQDASQLSDVFIKRMGHVYGADLAGESAQALYRQQLAGISQTWLGRASNLYGLMDNNDAFDYLGGLNLAVESVSGRRPSSAVINHSRPEQATIESLEAALLTELRGRFLNPQWIEPLVDEGYAGARTMGSEFFEYLWGWQVTSPDIIRDPVWEAVKAVYMDDSHNLGLDNFLSEGHNQPVQTNMLAIMLVAIDKGYWQADEATQRQLAAQLTANILSSGLPGSGHTHPNHPVFERVKALLPDDQATALQQVLDASRIDAVEAREGAARIAELSAPEAPTQSAADGDATGIPHALWAIPFAILTLLGAGFWRGRRTR